MTATLALSGCGLGAGAKPAATKLTITRDFGARAIRDLDAPAVGGGETVMRVLERNAKVATRFGGGFVQSIDGAFEEDEERSCCSGRAKYPSAI